MFLFLKKYYIISFFGLDQVNLIREEVAYDSKLPSFSFFEKNMSLIFLKI